MVLYFTQVFFSDFIGVKLIFAFGNGRWELVRESFELIAHRGGRGFGTDNTLSAMLNAVRAGVRFIETDVRYTSDGELVLCHDAIIWARAVRRITYEELTRIAPERPLLREVLDALASWVDFNLEIKEAPPGEVWEMIRTYSIDTTTLISSFDKKFLRSFKKIAPHVRCGYLYRTSYAEEKKIQSALEMGVEVVMPQFHSVSPELVDRAHSAGLKVIPWTVNDIEDLKKLIDWKVDGVVTDRYLKFKSVFMDLGG